jgi:hypothetical protein
MAMAMAWRWRWRGDGDGVAMAWRWRGVLGPLLPSSRFLVHRSNFLFFNMFIYIYEVKVTERCVAIGTHHHHGTAALTARPRDLTNLGLFHPSQPHNSEKKCCFVVLLHIITQ